MDDVDVEEVLVDDVDVLEDDVEVDNVDLRCGRTTGRRSVVE